MGNELYSNFDSQLMKDLCANSLRGVLKQLRVASIEELSRVSGLEVSMVIELVSELCFSGEFIEETIPGEEDHFYRFNGEYRLVLAICVLEKNRVFAAVSDLYGEYLEKEEITASPDTLQFFDDIVENYREKFPSIRLIAFGMPGFEERNSGRLLTVNFPKLQWTPFRDHFMQKYGLHSILENDVNAAVTGYFESKNFDDDKCVAALYLPQTHHPSAAICIDGKIYRGKDNAAGEVVYLDTSVQWKHFGTNEVNYSNINMDDLLYLMALPLIVYLNPHCLVIYGNWLPGDITEQLHKRLIESMPREFLPEIRFVPDILPDFLDGLVYSAIKALEPPVDLEEPA